MQPLLSEERVVLRFLKERLETPIPDTTPKRSRGLLGPMNEERVRRTLREYQRLEERLLELGAYVPFVTDPVAPNYRFPSPRAAEFGLECGTWLDTLMSELLEHSRLGEYPGIRSIRRKRRRNINLYREVFEESFGFAKGG
ncbi:MAG: hypothetical protein V3U30_05070 [Thermoplasmata archaeon]